MEPKTINLMPQTGVFIRLHTGRLEDLILKYWFGQSWRHLAWTGMIRSLRSSVHTCIALECVWNGHMRRRPPPKMSDRFSMRAQCVSGAITPVLRAVHVWLDQPKWTLMPGANTMKHQGWNINVRTAGSGAGSRMSLKIFTGWQDVKTDTRSISVIITKPHRQIYFNYWWD